VGSERAGRLRRGLAAGGRRALAAVATVALLAAGVLVLLLGGSGSGAATSSAAGGATGTVERRTLSERLTATGTIGYAGETTVLARLSGTVTALPPIGDVIRRGGCLYALDGEPVLLMYGAEPPYRTLAEGVSDGKDVEQLERNLEALGYEPGTVDQEFTYTTTAAVVAWQEDLGLEATGEIELGRVAFLRGAQRVTELETTLGEALGGGGGGEAESESASTPVLRTSSTRRIVSVELEADQQSIAHRGQKVEVVLPGGAEVPGEVHSLAAVELSGGEGNPGEEAEPGVEATISVTGKHRIPALDGATVSVLFTQQVRRHVLSVPLTALIAIGGGRFAVYVRGDGAPRRIVVTPGLAADGYVEVEGKGLREGTRVETGE
jgi:peptidoglycan hydrolase-like protein with peptidoglycan-binding domain